jgi:hypothetical protein
MFLRAAFFLLLTYMIPSLAPRLLGERKHVGQDFGREGDLDHLVPDDESEAERAQSDATIRSPPPPPDERDPLLTNKQRGSAI